jgi:hypothetical protein
MITKLNPVREFNSEAEGRIIRSKINEIIDFLNNLSLITPPKRYYREDYGWRYEVDENGNPIIPTIPIVGGGGPQ